MGTISALLGEKATELDSQSAVNDESWGQVKQAAHTALLAKGIDSAKADELLEYLQKEATETAELSRTEVDVIELANILTKTAAYVEELEAKIEDSNVKLSDATSQIEKAAEEVQDEKLSSLIDKGFSESDAEALSALPLETMDKVASLADGEPWDLGKGAGLAKSDLDPFTEFLLR